VLAAPAAANHDDTEVSVLSSRADQVSGGDALLRVDGPRRDLDELRVLHDGEDVTDAFETEDGALVGLVDGLALGKNRITVRRDRRTVAQRRLVNHPIEGPIFSGPHQVPFVCKTIQAGLGEPLADNQDGEGFRTPDGWSRNCSATTRGRLALPLHRRRHPAAAAARSAAGRRGDDHHHRRPHGPVRRPP
jgi:hypothetical protein